MLHGGMEVVDGLELERQDHGGLPLGVRAR